MTGAGEELSRFNEVCGKECLMRRHHLAIFLSRILCPDVDCRFGHLLRWDIIHLHKIGYYLCPLHSATAIRRLAMVTFLLGGTTSHG